MTMIERVARAILPMFDGADDFVKECALISARAAIDAMREPTDEVKAEINELAGPQAVAWWVAGHRTMIDVALKEI